MQNWNRTKMDRFKDKIRGPFIALYFFWSLVITAYCVFLLFERISFAILQSSVK